jgi:hypothetical protein
MKALVRAPTSYVNFGGRHANKLTEGGQGWQAGCGIDLLNLHSLGVGTGNSRFTASDATPLDG